MKNDVNAPGQVVHRYPKRLVVSEATRFLIKGSRSIEIPLPYITQNCSSLNADLYRLGITADSICTYGPFVEIAKHYLFSSSLIHHVEKKILLGTASVFPTDLDSLINENELFNPDINRKIMFEVF